MATYKHVILEGTSKALPDGATKECLVNDDEPISISVFVRRKKEMKIDLESNFPKNGKFMTVKQIEKEYGPNKSDLKKVKTFLENEGLAIEKTPRWEDCVRATGTAKKVQEMFNVEICTYTMADGMVFRGYEGNLSVPSELNGIVNNVLGLDTFPAARVPRH